MTGRVVTVVGDLDGRNGIDGIGWIGFVTIDCADPYRQVTFWSEATGWKDDPNNPNNPGAISTWPDGPGIGRPRSSTIAIRRTDGGVIGS